MKKAIFISVLSVSFVLTCLTAPVFAEKSISKDNAKHVNKYQKFFGNKKGVVGKDSSAQSTAGIAGGVEEGLKSQDYDKKIDECKSELYETPVNAIDKLIKTKDVKEAKSGK